jgi:hypothetical protein
MCPLQKAFVLQVGNVLVDGGQRAKAQPAGDLLIRRRIAIFLGEAGQEVDDFLLSTCNGHGEIVANKRRIAIDILGSFENT